MKNQEVETLEVSSEDTQELFDTAIINLTPEDMADYISDVQASTDVVMESMNMMENLNSSEAILFNSLYKSRIGLSAALAWLENHFSLNQEQEIEPQNKKKSKSPKVKEEKRIVYGETQNLVEDDSEQL